MTETEIDNEITRLVGLRDKARAVYEKLISSVTKEVDFMGVSYTKRNPAELQEQINSIENDIDYYEGLKEGRGLIRTGRVQID